MGRKNAVSLGGDWVISTKKKHNQSAKQSQYDPYASLPWASGNFSDLRRTRTPVAKAAGPPNPMSTSQSLADSTLGNLKVLDLTNIEQSTVHLTSKELCALELNIHMKNSLTLRLPFDKSVMPLDLLAALLQRTAESEQWFKSARDQ